MNKEETKRILAGVIKDVEKVQAGFCDKPKPAFQGMARNYVDEPNMAWDELVVQYPTTIDHLRDFRKAVLDEVLEALVGADGPYPREGSGASRVIEALKEKE